MPPTTVLVTGANRGIGLAIVKSLLTSPPTTPLTILACARSPPLPSPVSSTSDVTLSWHRLDLASNSSIHSLAKAVQLAHPDGLDVLINNAGVNLDEQQPPGIGVSQQTLQINYYGTVELTSLFLPLLKGPRRIVIVSSTGSTNLPADKKRRLAACRSLHAIEHMADQYLEAVRFGREEAEGWPRGLSYSVSKAMLNAAVAVLASHHRLATINACCPGWCATDTGKMTGAAPKSAADGATVPLKLAFEHLGGVSGRYWANLNVTDQGSGQVLDWTS